MRRQAQKWWLSPGVAGRLFATKKLLTEEIQAVIDRWPNSTPITGGDEQFLRAVLSHHHRWLEKCGVGFRHLTVGFHQVDGYRPTRGLIVHRLDGSSIDVSWTKALQPNGNSTTEQDAAAAARREVIDQTEAVRSEQTGKPCSICGRSLDGDCHVDHAAPLTFEALFAGWLAHEGTQASDLRLQDHGTHATFSDRAQAARWSNYHRARARLRLVHATENLSTLRVKR
jgi:hypothetical protein